MSLSSILSGSERKMRSWHPSFMGFFWVIQRIDQVSLQAPATTFLHHSSCFTHLQTSVYYGKCSSNSKFEHLELLLETNEVLGYRMIGPLIPHDVEVLNKWKDQPAHEATWKASILIQNQFPPFTSRTR